MQESNKAKDKDAARREEIIKKANKTLDDLAAIEVMLLCKNRQRMIAGKAVAIASMAGMLVSATAALPSWSSPVSAWHTVPWFLVLLCIGQWLIVSAAYTGKAASECRVAALKIKLTMAHIGIVEYLSTKEDVEAESVVEQ